MFRKTAPTLVLGAVLLVLSLWLGCSGDSDGDGASIDSESGLVRCQSCDDVDTWVQGVALASMNRAIDRNLDDIFGDGRGYDDDDDDWVGDDDDDAGDDDMGDDDDDAAPNDDDDSEGDADDDDDDHSDTNTQEEGVDEADIVKTDGDRLFVASGGYLLIFDPRPAGETHELSRVDLEGGVLEMFLYDDVVTVYSEVWPFNLDDSVFPGESRDYIDNVLLKVTVVDVSDLENPVVTRELFLEGEYQSSRRIDASSRIVVHTNAYVPNVQYWVDPYEAGCWQYWESGQEEQYETCMRQAYEELRARNREIILATPAEFWLPRYYDIRHTGAGEPEISEGVISACVDFYHTVDMIGNGTLSVVTIRMDDPMQMQENTTIIGDGHVVYASPTALYIAGDADVYYDWRDGSNMYTSEVHKFNLSSSPNGVAYVGSGTIDGWVLNQFSMGEKDGVLRIAATTGDWGERLSNHVFCLAEDNGGLQIIGEIRNIAVTERLYSARFMGDRGFLVTFEQTDPLWTLDMSDPENPQVVGELEVPGYSTYIHPLGDDHLLTIGLQGDDWGGTWGVQLTIFDVSDLANPTQAFVEEVGNWNTRSAAQYDHKAFLYYGKYDLLSIPLIEYGGYTDDDDDWDDDDDDWPDEPKGYVDPFAGFYLYRVTTNEGFEYKHSVEHTDFEGEEGSDPYYGLPRPQRSVVIDTNLYTFSQLGLVVTDLTTFEDLVRIDLPWQDPDEEPVWDDDDDAWGDDDDDDVEEGGEDVPSNELG